MKRKLFLLIVVLVLSMFLVGCSGGGMVTPETDTDKVEIEAVVQNFFLAINDQNWSEAEGLCIYGSDMWFFVESIKDAMNTLYIYYNVVTINCFVNITNVTVNGIYGTAKVTGQIMATADGYVEVEDIDGTFKLQKIGNNWKLY